MPEIFGAALMGGGSGPTFAAIGAIYPAGAICTCSYNGQTLTAKDTSGRALFLVPSAGQWLVKATNGGQEVEDTVSITTQGQVASVTLAFFSATIQATFPADCTSVVCTLGEIILSVPSGSLASGSYTFTVPSAGEWTLTATSSTATEPATATVNVTEETSYTVILSFDTYLFKAGTGLGNGVTIDALEASGDLSGTESLIWAKPGQTAKGNELQFLPAINFSEYSTINVDLIFTGQYSSSYSGTIAVTEEFRNGESVSTWDTLSKKARKEINYNLSRQTVSLDVGSISNEWYVTFYGFGSAGEIYNIWLE